MVFRKGHSQFEGSAGIRQEPIAYDEAIRRIVAVAAPTEAAGVVADLAGVDDGDGVAGVGEFGDEPSLIASGGNRSAAGRSERACFATLRRLSHCDLQHTLL